MKKILMALFFVLILSFGVIGVTQTVNDTNDIVEKQDNGEHKTVTFQ
ncbi:hypothetical protein [Lentibacillus cibarius]|nr:hypothetical protein [Lentibacillus cibarius]